MGGTYKRGGLMASAFVSPSVLKHQVEFEIPPKHFFKPSILWKVIFIIRVGVGLRPTFTDPALP